jgi:hypothetical protein
VAIGFAVTIARHAVWLVAYERRFAAALDMADEFARGRLVHTNSVSIEIAHVKAYPATTIPEARTQKAVVDLLDALENAIAPLTTQTRTFLSVNVGEVVFNARIAGVPDALVREAFLDAWVKDVGGTFRSDEARHAVAAALAAGDVGIACEIVA